LKIKMSFSREDKDFTQKSSNNRNNFSKMHLPDTKKCHTCFASVSTTLYLCASGDILCIASWETGYAIPNRHLMVLRDSNQENP
ncbi:hypothetical protein RFY10_11810, partial [Acinetobacter baumannii]|nr:hypothetical protein [Acinetobacter baumannii]